MQLFRNLDNFLGSIHCYNYHVRRCEAAGLKLEIKFTVRIVSSRRCVRVHNPEKKRIENWQVWHMRLLLESCHAARKISTMTLYPRGRRAHCPAPAKADSTPSSPSPSLRPCSGDFAGSQRTCSGAKEQQDCNHVETDGARIVMSLGLRAGQPRSHRKPVHDYGNSGRYKVRIQLQHLTIKRSHQLICTSISPAKYCSLRFHQRF